MGRTTTTSPGAGGRPRKALNRRHFVGAAGAALAAGGIGMAGLQSISSAGTAPGAGTPVPHHGAGVATPVANLAGTPEAADGFIEPPVLASQDGFLAVTLRAAPDPARGAGRLAYEQSLPGPTIRVRPGDQLKVALVNALDDGMTNLHVHGMHVSPKDNGDNVFIHVDRGQTFDYAYDIPLDHPPGFYWYHPHAHGMSSAQVSAGLAGAIVVTGGLDDLPAIAGVKERLLVLQGPFLDAGGTLQYLVNGQINPKIDIRPGETQRWRIVNVSANGFFNLQLAKHQFNQIATDGNPLPELTSTNIMLLGPGERVEVLVQGSAAGIYELRSIAWAVDVPSQAQSEFLVATMVSSGEAVEPMELPTTLIDREDFSTSPIDGQRVITFQENAAAPNFAIDGKAFVEDRVDQTVLLGTLEEWVIRNDSPEWHPFHIHVNDFQVMSINGNAVRRSYEDTTPIPPRGEIVIRTRFTDFTGKFVYHCHILGHEDAGMMGVVEVVE